MNQKIYWNDSASSYRIGKTNTDGSSREVVASDIGTIVYGTNTPNEDLTGCTVTDLSTTRKEFSDALTKLYQNTLAASQRA